MKINVGKRPDEMEKKRRVKPTRGEAATGTFWRLFPIQPLQVGTVKYPVADSCGLPFSIKLRSRRIRLAGCKLPWERQTARLQEQWMDGWTHGRLAEARAGIHGLDTEWAPRSVSSPLAVATEHGKWLGLKPLGVWAAPSCWLVASKASRGGKRVSLDANGGRQGSALHSSRVSTGSRRPGIATRACSRARQFDLEDRGQYLQ